MKEQRLSVSQVNYFVKSVLANNPLLKRLHVEGEISNFKWHSSGHLYFSLKDATGRLSCVMFRSDASNITFMPQDGMHVVASGRIDVYERGGNYQLYVSAMQPAGVGDLYLAYEALKKDLEKKGYFDKAAKKPLPDNIRKVGVVTASTGAAIHDIISVVKRRDPGVAITLSAAQVQGKGAAESIVRAIRRLDVRDDIDVIIVGRGGGSIEDLWAFNERPVADAIFHAHKMIISAVGHETDFLISDDVADLRAPTPSAAAEIVTEDREALKSTLMEMNAQMRFLMDNLLQHNRAVLLDSKRRLLFYSPQRMLDQHQQHLNLSKHMLTQAFDRIIKDKRLRLKALEKQLTVLNPKAILSRGYTMVYRGDKLIGSASQAKSSDDLRIIFYDGPVRVKVTEGDNNGDKEI